MIYISQVHNCNWSQGTFSRLPKSSCYSLFSLKLLVISQNFNVSYYYSVLIFTLNIELFTSTILPRQLILFISYYIGNNLYYILITIPVLLLVFLFLLSTYCVMPCITKTFFLYCIILGQPYFLCYIPKIRTPSKKLLLLT